MEAYRITTDCPECGAFLRVRRRRDDREPFLGCSRFPHCKFAEDVLPIVADLEDRVRGLRVQLAEARRQRPQPAAPSLDLAGELRGLIALAHPDRWPDAPDLAHEVTARLTDLRRRVAA